MGVAMTVWAVVPGLRPTIVRDVKDGRGLAALQGSPCCRLDKTWGAIHFMLTGTAYEGTLPEAFLLEGGECLREPEDESDAPPRWIVETMVPGIDDVLRQIDDKELAQHCDIAAMVAADVYSVCEGDADDLMEELSTVLLALKELVATAAETRHALIIAV